MRSILLLPLMVILLVILLSTENGDCQAATSTLLPVVERVFIRRRRALLVPPGTNMKFTVNLSKRLIATYPRGFNFVLEAAAYYPMPSSREDFLPKRLRKPTTPKPPMSNKPTEPLFVHIPGSLVRYKAKPAKKPPKVNRIDDGPVRYYDNPQQYAHYANATRWNKWAHKYNYTQYPQTYSKYEQQPWQPKHPQDYAKYEQPWQPKNPQAKWTRYTTTERSYYEPNWSTKDYNHYANWRPNRHWKRDASEEKPYEDLEVAEHTPMYFDDLEQFDESPHYHKIRQRRHLFHVFSGLGNVLGFDMKTCLLRTICDTKQFLLPPGYSMIHDILRVMFTFPTIDGLDDEYSQIMRADYETCDRALSTECPFSILDYLLNSK